MGNKTMKKAHKFNYDWKLSDGYPAPGIEKHGRKVFSCFACGGGSTMGYKLAGYDVIGCNEIDPKMNEAYTTNHKPKFNFLEDIREFKKRDDLPLELYNLDILDGSPPCSSFSMAGSREDGWGKEKKFREGQTEQVLDTLFFDFIDLAEKLQPKVVIAENVKGLMVGAAKEYVYKITEALSKAGYVSNLWLLNSSVMGVPQKRERTFFVALRNDMCANIEHQYTMDMFNPMPVLDLDFDEPHIKFGEIRETGTGRNLSEFMTEIWSHRKPGDSDFSCTNGRFRDKPNTGFGQNYVYDHKVCNTLTSKEDCVVKFDEPKYLSMEERAKVQTFPTDYKYCKSAPHYLQGMSVPPLMTAQIANRIKEQWFDNIMFEKKEDAS